LGKNITTIKKNTEALSEASREADLEENTEKTLNMVGYFLSPKRTIKSQFTDC